MVGVMVVMVDLRAITRDIARKLVIIVLPQNEVSKNYLCTYAMNTLKY